MEAVKTFLQKAALNVSALEKEISCPPGTIQLWIKGHKPLPEKWHNAVYLKSRAYGYRPSSIYDDGRPNAWPNEVVPSSGMMAYIDMFIEKLDRYTEQAVAFIVDAPEGINDEHGLCIFDAGVLKACALKQGAYYWIDIKSFIYDDVNGVMNYFSK